MMLKRLIVYLIFFFPTAMMGQTNEEYEKMLDNLYKKTVELVTCNQLAFELSRDTSIILLDTREYVEYKVSHLNNALHAGYKDFSLTTVENVPKDRKIIVYCSVGARSEEVGGKLKEAGYENVYNLHGGIFQWKNQGYPIYNMNDQETDSVHAYSKEWGKWLLKGKKIYEW